MGGIPIKISGVTGAVVSIDNNLGCAVGDVALITSGSSCAISSVIAKTDINQITLKAAPGVTIGSIACLGGWNETVFAVDKNTLVENGAATVAGIVNIQAQYGISATANDNQVTEWVDAGGATWGAPSVANRNRIKAIRIAVVARNGLLEKENVTSVCSSVTEALPTGLCAWEGSEDNPAPAIDLSKNTDGTNNPDWKRYRYRVFETIIPMRNLIWSKDTL
jgi:type IV pilus assembly protein PilW